MKHAKRELIQHRANSWVPGITAAAAYSDVAKFAHDCAVVEALSRFSDTVSARSVAKAPRCAADTDGLAPDGSV